MTAAIVFLRLNGIGNQVGQQAMGKVLLDVAAGRIDRAATTARLRKLVRMPKPKRKGKR